MGDNRLVINNDNSHLLVRSAEQLHCLVLFNNYQIVPKILITIDKIIYQNVDEGVGKVITKSFLA